MKKLKEASPREMGRVLNFFTIGRPKMNFLKLQREIRCTLRGSAEAAARQGSPSPRTESGNGFVSWMEKSAVTALNFIRRRPQTSRKPGYSLHLEGQTNPAG